MPLVNLDYQNFWEPPSVKGPSHGHRAKQPSPPKRRQPGSSDSKTEQGSWLKVENSCTGSLATQGQIKDEPIIIASDAESENEAEDQTLYDADGGIIPPASSPPSDDTLPSLEQIVASTAENGCDDILMNEKHESTEEQADRAYEDNGKENCHEQSLPTLNIAQDDAAAVVSLASRTGSISSCSSALHSPTSSTPSTPFSQQGDKVPSLKSASCEIDIISTKGDVGPADHCDTCEPTRLLQRSSRSSSAPDNCENRENVWEAGGKTCAQGAIATGSSEISRLSRSCSSVERDETMPEAGIAVENDGYGHMDNSCHEDNYCPSSDDEGEAASDYQVDEIGVDAEQSPRKRRKTRRSQPSASKPRSVATSPHTTWSEALSSPSLLSRPSSLHASTYSRDAGADSATFEEWNGTVKVMTINGVTSFEGHFEGELSSNCLIALFRTHLATKKERCTSSQGKSGGFKRTTGQRGQYTREEDELLVYLKEDRKLPWNEIHRRFSKKFSGRSKGTLQVRYCTKLKDRQR